MCWLFKIMVKEVKSLQSNIFERRIAMKTKLLKLVYFASVLVGCGSDNGGGGVPSAMAEVANPAAAVCEASAPAATEEPKAKEEKAAKLLAKECVDPKPSEVKKGVKITLCNDTIMEGTMEQSVTTVAAAVAATPATSYSDCSSNSQTGCLANSTYAAYDGSNLSASNIKLGTTVAGIAGSYAPATYSDCSANGQTGCIATSSYPANSLALANLVPANVRNGVTIGAVTGTFNPAVESHTDCTGGYQTGCIATSSFPTESHAACSANGQTGCFIPSSGWKAIGEFSYGNIISSNLLSGVVIAGVTGTVSPSVAPHPYAVRKGYVTNGTTGLLQVKCRNSEVTAPAAQKCSTVGWNAPDGQKYYNHFMDLTFYKLGVGGSYTWVSTYCAGLTEDGGGWRVPSREEVQQAVLHQMPSIAALSPGLQDGPPKGYWVSLGSATHGNIVNPSGSYITGVINSDANQFGLCVK